VLFYRYFVEPFTVFKKLGIPGPTPLPILGNTGRTLFDVGSCYFSNVLCCGLCNCYPGVIKSLLLSAFKY